MKNKIKKASAFLMVTLLLTSNTVLAGSGWYTADGGSYTKANSYSKRYYDGITINISKIAKNGKNTDNSSYKKAKVKVYASNSNAEWKHSSSSYDTIIEKQTAYRTCKKGTTYTFVLTDTNGNPKNTSITTYIQNATVKKVIEGDETLLNKEINLTKTGGLIINEEFTDKVYIDTLSCINIMKPNNHYLIFCEKSEISDMLDTNIPEYRFVNAKFTLLNIDHDDQTTISDFELINEEPYTMYTQYSEHEFFTASEETLSAFLEIKHEILEQYK